MNPLRWKISLLTRVSAIASTIPPVRERDDTKATWAYLEVGIERIMTDLRSGMDMKTYMGLYTAIHNFCTPTRNDRGGAILQGEALYQHLVRYLKLHLKHVQARSREYAGEALLTFYIQEWNRYSTAARYINLLFRYLNRIWVHREQGEGKKNIYDIHTLHLVRWKEDIFAGIQEKVMRSVLKLVETQRNGEIFDKSCIKPVIDSFVSLGLENSDSSQSTLDVYRAYFEKPFLEATARYYDIESNRFLAENSIIDYMKKAEACLEEEKNSVSLYHLNEITSPLMRTCEKALITNHSQTLQEGIQILLDYDKQEDLGRMYKLLSRIPEGIDPLRTRFEAHVWKAGLSAVEKIAPEGNSIEPRVYINALLDVCIQYQDFVNRAFNGQSEFVRSLKNACREFVNRNKICKPGSKRSPELFAKYIDDLLKKKTEDDIEKLLTEVITIFKYIEDKDIFLKFHSRLMAKRLVRTTSASGHDHVEMHMISKLKDAYGLEYTRKVQRMFQDMEISKDLNMEWKLKTPAADDVNSSIDSTYRILGAAYWPLRIPTTHFSPPNIIAQNNERFAKFYDDKYDRRRKLMWMWPLCTGEVKANFCKVPHTKDSPTLQVSVYQMAILLLFNDSDVVTYDEMAMSINLSKAILGPSIGVFVKAKVLLVQPKDAKPNSGTSYKLNFGFKAKKKKINFNISIKSEQQQETNEAHKTIKEDRKLLMQSAIVRIMKSRKKMQYQQLISETIQNMRDWFNPDVLDIKKSIDILLEKEYLERLEGDELGYAEEIRTNPAAPAEAIWEYKDIRQKTELRLLLIEPGEFNDEVRCTLDHWEIKMCPEYEAISYTWADESGIDTKNEKIYLNGSLFSVTANCEAALRRVRMRQERRTIWIDAVCINQENKDERGHQVQLMPNIYMGAKKVLIYLGEPTSDEEKFLGMIHPELLTQHNPKDIGHAIRELLAQHNRARIGRALHSLLRRRYFSRVWILQEIDFAREQEVLCGDYTVPWKLFRRIPKFIDDIERDGNKSTSLPKVLTLEQRKYREPSHFVDLLDLARNTEATDQRDKVFAVFGMLNCAESLGCVADYNKSIEKVYCETAVLLAGMSGLMAVLVRAVCRRNIETLPPWVPDWSHPYSSGEPILSDKAPKDFPIILSDRARCQIEFVGARVCCLKMIVNAGYSAQVFLPGEGSNNQILVKTTNQLESLHRKLKLPQDDSLSLYATLPTQDYPLYNHTKDFDRLLDEYLTKQVKKLDVVKACDTTFILSDSRDFYFRGLCRLSPSAAGLSTWDKIKETQMETLKGKLKEMLREEETEILTPERLLLGI